MEDFKSEKYSRTCKEVRWTQRNTRSRIKRIVSRLIMTKDKRREEKGERREQKIKENMICWVKKNWDHRKINPRTFEKYLYYPTFRGNIPLRIKWRNRVPRKPERQPWDWESVTLWQWDSTSPAPALTYELQLNPSWVAAVAARPAPA